ncbi:hypothetical protein, partial [Helcococcus ovis]|uniref:hypothetical protein n=1 Tax=Helcococcus ovis TaxID=72026 RepID=UPI0038B95CFC
MIYNIFQLGLRDVKNNIKKIFVFNIIILLITVPIISSIDSTVRILFNSDNKVANKVVEKNLVPISFENISDNMKYRLFDYYKNYTKTYYRSHYFSKIFNQDIIYIDGRSDKLLKNKGYLLSQKNINSNVLKKVENKMIFDNILGFTDILQNLKSANLYIFEIVDSNEILNSYKKLNKSELFEMINNTKTSNLDLILKLKEIFKNSFVELEVNDNIKKKEIKFIFEYIHLYNILIFVLLIFSLYYFYEEIFVKLRKEYKVHYISGSSL